MTTLNTRAQAIRQAASSALDDQKRGEIVQRSVALAGKLGEAAKRVAQSQDAVRTLVDLKIVPTPSAIVPSDGHVQSLIRKAEQRVSVLAEFIQSALPGELELAAGDYARTLETAAKEAWKQYVSERAASIGAENELLTTALGSIPRFRETIEETRSARLKVKVLMAREVPSGEEIQEFQTHLVTLEEANKELEREIPPAFQDTLRRCATRTGVSPNDLPDGFLEWVDEVGARRSFKVTLSDL